jgi:hypothetical protein
MIKIAILIGAVTCALMASNAQAATCVGNCGTLGADGVVSASPLGGSYQYVSTSGGVSGGASLGVGNESNGSTYTSSSFTAAAGDSLEFYFNFVTSDGIGFSDYAFSRLNGATSSVIFTARTTQSGDTVPGFNLPGLASVLTPATTPIIGGAPAWAPLGGSSSGRCYGVGCGYTGWIKSTYTIATAGTYTLSFGATNISDTAYDTGLAFSGITVAGVSVGGVPEPTSWALMLTGFGLVGGALRRRSTNVVAA